MNENALQEFKKACFNALDNFSLYDLRVYGRFLKLTDPTKLKKGEILPLIVGVLSGEITPAGRNNRGAPVKNKNVNPEITATVDALKKRYFQKETASYEELLEELKEDQMPNDRSVLTLESNNKSEIEEWMDQVTKRVFRGQLQILNEVPRLLPLDCGKEEETIVVPEELIRKHDLREGDVIACHATKGKSVFVVREVLTVNEIQLSFLRREKFEESEACYPYQFAQFVSEISAPLSAKYLQWLLPLYQGQHGCIVSSPKVGKTLLLYEIATSAMKSARDLKVLVLLNAQSPETVWQFRNADFEDQLVYTTYDDTPEKQVFAAEFLLKRAKRFAECGKNVLLLVDSFNALARAYNETEYSAGGKVLAGGLESKTLQYVRRFFGSARCLKRGGSLTVLGTVACNTGNPFDEQISLDLSGFANYQIYLSEELASKRLYPAIDLFKSNTRTGGFSLEEQTELARLKICREFLLRNGEEVFYNALASAENYEAFLSKIGAKI